MIDIENFKKGIFNLRTRRFGTVAEIMIKKLFKLGWASINSHDLCTVDGKKIEVKFSTALKSNSDSINENNIIDEVLKARTEQRMFTQQEWEQYDFNCNIQQVKKVEFDILYYGIFFSDQIEIFCISKDNIQKGTSINYSDKQHRGNQGEGQFHLNRKTYPHHKKLYFRKSINYEELVELLAGKKGSV